MCLNKAQHWSWGLTTWLIRLLPAQSCWFIQFETPISVAKTSKYCNDVLCLILIHSFLSVRCSGHCFSFPHKSVHKTSCQVLSTSTTKPISFQTLLRNGVLLFCQEGCFFRSCPCCFCPSWLCCWCQNQQCTSWSSWRQTQRQTRSQGRQKLQPSCRSKPPSIERRQY